MAHKTVSIQGRVEICSIASLARAYEKEGIFFRSKSDILWHAVEQLSLMYERKHGDERFTDPTEAINYMESKGLSLGTNARAMKALFQAQADHSYFEETGTEFSGFQNKDGKYIGSGSGSLREMAEEFARRRRWKGVDIGDAEVSPSLLSPEERAERTAEEDRLMKQKQKEAIIGMKREKEE